MEVAALDEAGKKVDWFFIYKVPQLAAGATTDKTTPDMSTSTTTHPSTNSRR
jgi:hypothetical protein